MTTNLDRIYTMYMRISEAWQNLTPIAQEQWGHFTTRQALNAGLDRTQLMRMVKDARIEHLATGSYRITGAPQDKWTQLRGQWMHLINTYTTWNGPEDGPPPLIIGRDAASDFHELGNIVARVEHFYSSNPIVTTMPGVRVLRRKIGADEWMWYQGMPMTTPGITIRDQASVSLDGDELGRMIYDAARLELVYLADLAQLLHPIAPTYGLRTGWEMIEELPAYGGCDIAPFLAGYELVNHG